MDHEQQQHSPRRGDLSLRQPMQYRADMGDLIQNVTPSIELGSEHPALSIRMGSTSSRSDEDGEGESPGLDALATAASEMVDV